MRRQLLLLDFWRFVCAVKALMLQSQAVAQFAAGLEALLELLVAIIMLHFALNQNAIFGQYKRPITLLR
ncbi:MAG: hypothetical protein ACI87E_000580 [Mariniblastus sp.]|jgi:hypothetical protein